LLGGGRERGSGEGEGEGEAFAHAVLDALSIVKVRTGFNDRFFPASRNETRSCLAPPLLESGL
jgi:hypothetical protein